MEERRLQVENVTGINPWIDIPLDPTRQTGGDWYRILLTTSLNGKSIHGANTTPSMELIFKCRPELIDERGFGVIRWDDVVERDWLIGTDISDGFYRHHQYRGTTTVSGSMLHSDIGVWEPNVRRRARSAAILTAGMYVHGVPKAEAMSIINKVTSDEMDIEAVESVVLPTSHLKREMVMVSKSSHRVFSRGTIQRGVIWNDDRLRLPANIPTMAFDWGRVTVMARYIAEANIQNCRTFADVAKAHGVPFTIVANAWAYVSELDYRFRLTDFDNVPSLNIDRFDIPKLKGSFRHHEQDIMEALIRDVDFYAKGERSESFDAYVRLLEKSRKYSIIGKKRRHKDLGETSYVTSHMYTDENVVGMISYSRIARHSYLRALATKAATDYNMTTLGQEVSKMLPNVSENWKAIDKLSRLIYDRTTWILSRAILEKAIKEHEGIDGDALATECTSAVACLNNLKQDIIGFPTHLDAEVGLSNTMLVKNRVRTIEYARLWPTTPACLDINRHSFTRSTIDEAATLLAKLGSHALDHLAQIRDTIGQTLRDWYTELVHRAERHLIVLGAKFALAADLLLTIDIGTCMLKESGYIDGASPMKSFVYRGMKRVSRDLLCEVPKPKLAIYSDALSLAKDLSSLSEVDVLEATHWTIDIMDCVVGDLMRGEVYALDPSLFYDFLKDNNATGSPGYDTCMMEESMIEAQYLASFADLDFDNILPDRYQACLNTYPNPSIAEAYAKANGYSSFRDAYDTIGEMTLNKDGNEFVEKGRSEAVVKRDADGNSPSGSTSTGGTVPPSGYESII